MLMPSGFLSKYGSAYGLGGEHAHLGGLAAAMGDAGLMAVERSYEGVKDLCIKLNTLVYDMGPVSGPIRDHVCM
jgi:hypothetical protein